jgi:hypothetical protein
MKEEYQVIELSSRELNLALESDPELKLEIKSELEPDSDPELESEHDSELESDHDPELECLICMEMYQYTNSFIFECCQQSVCITCYIKIIKQYVSCPFCRGSLLEEKKTNKELNVNCLYEKICYILKRTCLCSVFTGLTTIGFLYIYHK